MTTIPFIDTFLRRVAAAIDGVSRADVDAVVDLLVATARAGRRVYIIGNGGSAATASHMAVDLAKQATVPGQPALRAIALTDNVPLITAFSNDEDYALAFVRQLEIHLDPGDVLIAISCSGTSPNILRAAELARARGARVVAFSGETGGALRALADLSLLVPLDDVGAQEVVHLAIDHVIAMAIFQRLAAT
jgi:D-sedoheptulose 7-phosphate isomerase